MFSPILSYFLKTSFSANTLSAGATEFPFREVSARKMGLTTSTKVSSGKTVAKAGVIAWKAQCCSLFSTWR